MHFPKNFVDVLRTPILLNTDRLLLLKYLLKIKTAALDKFSETAVRRYFSKWMFLKISYYFQETTLLESLFNKAAGMKY